ncbi:MAG: transcriptional coactivator p15/PC4 family protein [Candidatus Thorarchaeota archaeon]|jgi:hypothetical protein
MQDVAKNDKGDMIRIQLKEYKGKHYLDIRNFYAKDGKLNPTKKGISIPDEIAFDVINAATDELHQFDRDRR